ncbi:serine/threonine protein phosphatase 2A 57 kDa regulatory subunit B' beta isoform-like [Tripterygium wilfordii]|uniref:Serine/threonine protein phosphatase 2A regulatory subunit n=2 Tax=Tripterygium wilfordii TaxID=458696 RepID=A0A7J7DHR3_TRIWF|nr:serine/threonine protein phosphatase 2A 57 kDa regulatory subunit B' beta isoform-like [Tripterygium wilfordii]
MGVHRNSPKNSPKGFEKKSSTTLRFLFDLDSKSNSASNNLRSPKNVGLSCESEHQEVLSIISYCSFIFSFADSSVSPSQQDLKRLKLNQLLSMVKTAKRHLSDQVLPSLMSMLSVNIFRPLPPPSSSSFASDLPDDEEVVSAPSPAWPHLQLVYEILLRLVLNEDPKTLCNYIDNRFLINLLSLFQSEDPRERESLKNVYHRIYSRFTFYRSFMRKSMNDVFLNYVFMTERHCGIGELLEIWGSIINGFTVPLREEHRLFLMRVLIPLHMTKGMQIYHRQLAYCVSQFVQKEPVLGGVVVRGILKYWPVTNCQKEVLLIGEIEELVENIDPDQYRKLALPICTRIIKCLNSWNSQVAERALYVWNNEHFVKMISSAAEEVFPVLVEGMEKNLKWHWSKSVKQLTENVKLMLEGMDPSLYCKCLQETDQKEFRAREEEIKRKQNWEMIELAAAQNQLVQICVSH